MNMKRKLIGIVGALTLTMSMTGGSVSAQDEVTTSTVPIRLIVACSTHNQGTGSAVLSTPGSDGPVAFSDFNPDAEAQSVDASTPDKAFRIDVSLGNCPSTTWSVTAGISDFVSGENVIPGTNFQLPVSEPKSDATWMANETTPASNVTGPSGTVSFVAGGAESGVANVSSVNLAQASGTTPSTNATMYRHFAGELIGLDENTPAGTYDATFIVTFNASTP
jgi:hypothetical protein